VLKISEVYEKQIKTTQEHPNGSEIPVFEKVLDSRECLISRDYIVSVHPFEYTSSSDQTKAEAAFPSGTKFSTLIIDGNSFRKSEIVVVGSFDRFCRLLQENIP